LLRSLKLRTKLALIVVIPMIAALAVAVPGFRSRRHDYDAISNSRALLRPARTVTAYLDALNDEASLSAWWVASADPAVKPRLAAARRDGDRIARQLPTAAVTAADHHAPAAADRIRALHESVALLSQERQFVDLRITPDDAVLGYYRDLAAETTSALDAFVRAPRIAVAVTMFRDLATMARLQAGAADERSILAVAYSRGSLSDALASDLVAAVTLQDTTANALQGQGRAATRDLITSGLRSFRSASDEVRQRRATALTTRALAFAVTPAQWYSSATAQMKGWTGIRHHLERSLASGLRDRQDHARLVLWYYALGALGALVLAGGLAFLVARAIRRPLRQLADNARDVADHQLPALVDALGDDTVVPPTITPLNVRSRDEIGALARAFNHVERTTVDVAEQQRQAVRTGISDLYVNLARRNQPLLSRQMSLIEDLEREERDPDRLATLFTLDHLATRMRRNSDSLLVLAGQDDLLTDPAAVPLLDVVRGAVSETADFGRIDTAGIPPDIEVAGHVAPDLAHAVSELLENATEFSPPGSRVVIVARRAGEGIELTISDEGIGIPGSRLDALNHTLAHPPLPGLATSRALGLVVVARLAHRIGVAVTLRSAPDIGTAAILSLPATILRTAPAQLSNGAQPLGVGPGTTPPAASGDPSEPRVVPEIAIGSATLPPDPVDVDLTAAESAERGADPAAASPLPSRPTPGADTSRNGERDDVDALPRRGRHHHRRRRRGGADLGPASEPTVTDVPTPPVTGTGDASNAATRWLAPDRYQAPPPAPEDATATADVPPPALPSEPSPASSVPPPSGPPLAPSPPSTEAAPETRADAPADDEVTAAGLPRRTPHPATTREPNLAAAPPPRPPDAVFELVARYEAGRRRAGSRPTDPEEQA
jgi:signal transduction histidine kinase